MGGHSNKVLPRLQTFTNLQNPDKNLFMEDYYNIDDILANQEVNMRSFYVHSTGVSEVATGIGLLPLLTMFLVCISRLTM